MKVVLQVLLHFIYKRDYLLLLNPSLLNINYKVMRMQQLQLYFNLIL